MKTRKVMNMDEKKTQGQLLQEELFCKQEHVARLQKNAQKEATTFCEGYKTFLDEGKTERECVIKAVDLLEKAGYVPFDTAKKYNAGDKVYYNNREKAIIASTIGTKGIEEGVRIIAAHIDSPRLDIKPNPLYEASDLALMKTHYYGGVRKYQWVAIPLALHGVVVKKNGETVQISIGEKEEDPVFTISDLLPHLSADQNKRTLPDGIKGEELNIICGALPYDDEKVKEQVKLKVLEILHNTYGIKEQDFMRAEIEAVPAFKAKDIGFDRALIGAYGQDDRVCSYPALVAEIEAKNPAYTTVTVLTDKEEIGSDGNTGLNSAYLEHFITYLAEMQGQNAKTVFANSKCLSADVNAGFDPTFPDVSDPRNNAYLNNGVVVTKYTGARGKGGTSDASAEYTSFVIDMLEDANIVWQTGELGKVDQGGGGTVAMYVASKNCDVIDIGVPLLSMHAPYEVSSKLDVLMLYKAFIAFYA